MLKKIHLFLLILIFIYIFSAKELYAIVLFSDDFNVKDNSKWKFDDNGGEIFFNDGVMSLMSSALHFPFITNSEAKKFNNFENVILEYRFNYGQIGFMGDGIGVGYTGDNDYPYYQFSIWNDLDMGLVFQYRNVEVLSNSECNYSNTPLLRFSLSGNTNNEIWHIFKIEKNNRKYTISYDSQIIFVTNDNQCIPQNMFIGNSQTGGRTDWNRLNIDYVKLYTDDLSRNKIIILPGLGASWNPEAILLGSTASSFQWTMTPFVKNYDLLIDSLEANGLVRNQDFYVWNYDWRKPLSQIVSNFSDYINSLNLETGEKLDLVGHSLGGLVARIWTQDNYDVVNQTITLGSPHFGAVKAYEAWNGAKISDNLDVASIAINVLLQIQNKNYDTSVQTLRNYAPIVYDLSPTFSFLKRNGNNVTGRFSEYLNQKNDIVAAINDKLITVDGEGVATKEYINLGDRSLFDKVLNIWEDGRPLSYIYGQGDGTVLKKSALISGSENIGFDSEHGALVNKSTNWILTKLGLGITTSSTFNYPQKQVVFYLSSPAVMVVNCGGTERSDIDGWVIMENQESKNCQIKLTGKDGGGTYHLVIGENDKWKYFEGEIANQQILNIVLNDEEIYWQMLKRDFSNLKAVGAIVAVEQKNMVNTIDEYLKFRIKTRKFKYSEEILENMKYILDNKIFSPLEINNMYIKALASKSLVETNLRLLARMGILPKYEAALNYEQANNFMSRGKNYAANYLANKLYGIVWK